MRLSSLLTTVAASALITFTAAPTASANWLGLPGLGAGTADWVREYATDSTLVTMYAATEDDGVFRSTNNGLSWSAFNSGLEGVAGAKNVRTVFTSGTTVYAGTTAGLFKSTGGSAWTPIESFQRPVQAIFSGGGAMLAGVASGGVWRSTDGGATWKPPAPGNGMLAAETVWSLGSFKDNGALIYAATQSGIYVSTDFGTSWTLSNDGISGTTLRAWADDKYPNIYYAGSTDGLFRSVNAGLTWTKILAGTTVRAIQQFNGIDAKRIYAATNQGVLAGQTDLHPLPGKVKWRPLTTDGMAPNTEVWGLNSYINTPGTLLAGTHGGGGKALTLTPPIWAGVKPAISDTTPHKAQKLSVASNGTWAGTPTIEFSYQWQDCTTTCADIKDATDAEFVVPQQNRKYRVVVTARNDFPTGGLVSKESDITAASTAEPGTLPGDNQTNTGSIKLIPAGQPQPGTVLQAQGWLFNPAATSTGFQWYRCVAVGSCVKLQGATGVTHTLTDQDVGERLCVAVTGHNASGSTTLGCTGLTNEVLAPDPKQLTAPTLAGTAWVGHTLIAGVGTWAFSGTRFERRWQRCNAEGESCETTGVTSASYVIGTADLGKRLRAEITVDSNAANKLPNPVAVYTPLSPVVTREPVKPNPPAAGGGGGGTPAPAPAVPAAVVQPPAPPADTLAPALAVRSATATSLTLTLSEPAALTVRYERLRAGRKAGKKCKAGGRKGAKCTVVTTIATVKVNAAAGASTVKLPKRKLAKGDYRLVVVATDAAGNQAAAKPVRFKVKQ